MEASSAPCPRTDDRAKARRTPQAAVTACSEEEVERDESSERKQEREGERDLDEVVGHPGEGITLLGTRQLHKARDHVERSAHHGGEREGAYGLRRHTQSSFSRSASSPVSGSVND